MLGVILWSDAADGKAVIWCEDQGDLAYLNAKDDVLQAGDFFDAGDLVQFDMEVSQSIRRANNLRLVIEKAGTQLPNMLREGAEPPERQQEGVKVLPFPHREELFAAVG
ncbi:MAG: hypothetical protein AAF999_06845 [Pseudomonadota bacterium]